MKMGMGTFSLTLTGFLLMVSMLIAGPIMAGDQEIIVPQVEGEQPPKMYFDLRYNNYLKQNGTFLERYDYRMPVITASAKYDDFAGGQKCEPETVRNVNKDIEAQGKKYVEQKIKVMELVEKVLACPEEDCVKVANFLKDFLAEVKETDRHVNANGSNRNELYHGRAKSSDIQMDHPTFSVITALSTSGDVYRANIPYEELIKVLIDIMKNGIPEVVRDNGDTVEDCRNVDARGVNNLDHFYIDMEKATTQNIRIKYNTYSVKDQLLVEQGGSGLFDSGCVGTEGMKDGSFNVPRVGPGEKIKIRINGNCPSGEDGTAWEFHLYCTNPDEVNPVMFTSCGPLLKALVEAMRELIRISLPLIHHYWTLTDCNQELHGVQIEQLRDLLTPLEGYTDLDCTIGNNYCRGFPESSLIHLASMYKPKTDVELDSEGVRAGAKEMNPDDLKQIKTRGAGGIDDDMERNAAAVQELHKELLKSDQEVKEVEEIARGETSEGVKGKSEKVKMNEGPMEDPVRLTSSLGIKEEEEKKSKVKKNEFPNHRGWVNHGDIFDSFKYHEKKKHECSDKPSEDESLFKTVSWAYCKHAWKRLFGTYQIISE